MDSSGSADNDQERNDDSREIPLVYRRYHDRIWCLSPETWLAIVFFLLVLGLSLLTNGYCFCFFSDADRDIVMKFGALVLCSGWIAFIFLLGRIHSRRNWFIPNRCPEFVGVSIGPPIQPEFLSAMLLPEIVRGWVPAETLPGFEPRHAEVVRPPTQEAAAVEESLPKRRRNRKNKVNNSVSEFDSASQESKESKVQIATVDANHEDSQLRDLRTDGDHPSKVKTQEREQEFNNPNQDSEQQSLQESNGPTELNPDGENLNKLISGENNQVRHQLQASNHRSSSRLNDTIDKDSTSALDKVVEENPASDMESEKSTLSTNTSSSEMQQVISKPVSPDFIAFTPKRKKNKKNKRKKK